MSSTSKQGQAHGHGQGRDQGQGQGQQQELEQEQTQSKSKSKSKPEPELEMIPKDTNTTKEVELALHAKSAADGLSNDDDLTVAQQAHSTAAGQEAEELPEDADNHWGHMLRVLTRCLMYCSARLAAGFGLSRQQTAWYKHCWDNPGQRPRGLSFLGTHEAHLPPGGPAIPEPNN